jgi:hypothetical protein
MKLEPFDHATKQWDRFKEFYNEVELISARSYYVELISARSYYHAPFIQLETGEFIVTQGYYKPRYRRHYEAQNVAIANSDDHRWSGILTQYKLTTPDGDIVKPSWLNNKGAQALWIDYDSNHVVHIQSPGYQQEGNKRIPKRLRNTAQVYYAAPDEAPIGACPIRVTEVDKLNRDEKDHVNAIRAACKVWNELSEEAKSPPGVNAPEPFSYVNRAYVPRHPMHVADLLHLTFNDMDWQARKRVALHGVISRKKTTEFTHLLLTK